MSDIATKNSPRFENGAWKWYVGNTFNITFTITITGLNQSDLTGYNMAVEFYNDKQELVYSFPFTTFTCTVPESGKVRTTITLAFTETITKRFTWGKYAYCIKLIKTATSTTDKEIATIYGEGKAEVELCH